MKMERLTLKIASFLVLIKDNKILLLRRCNTGWNDGLYSFPAGHLDPSETIVNALVRESKEEIGIIINEQDAKLVHTMHRIKECYVDFFFLVNNYSGEIENKEPDKCDDLTWFSLDELPENIIPMISSFLQSYKKNELFSEL